MFELALRCLLGSNSAAVGEKRFKMLRTGKEETSKGIVLIG